MNKKTFFSILAIFAISLCFISCSKDDDDNNTYAIEKADLIGSWEVISVSNSTTFKHVKPGCIFVFNSNNTCSTPFSMENHYEIKSGKVYTYYKSTMEPMYVYSLISTEDDIASLRMNGTLDESNLSITIKARKK